MTCSFCDEPATLNSHARHGAEKATCLEHVGDAVLALMKGDGLSGIAVHAAEQTFHRYSGEARLSDVADRERFDAWVAEHLT